MLRRLVWFSKLPGARHGDWARISRQSDGSLRHYCLDCENRECGLTVWLSGFGENLGVSVYCLIFDSYVQTDTELNPHRNRTFGLPKFQFFRQPIQACWIFQLVVDWVLNFSQKGVPKHPGPLFVPLLHFSPIATPSNENLRKKAKNGDSTQGGGVLIPQPCQRIAA